MSLSRRKFMKAGMMATIFAGLPLTFIKEAAAQKNGKPGLSKKTQGMIAYYNAATFAPYVNSSFRVNPDSRDAKDLKLTKVENFSAQDASRKPEDEIFSLYFTGAAGTSLPQQTYKVEHAALGEFSLFVVPNSPHGGTCTEYYEAAFNRRNK